MTLAELHERAMRAYVRARVLEGALPDDAAREAVETWVDSGRLTTHDRAALVERLSVAGTQAAGDTFYEGKEA